MIGTNSRGLTRKFVLLNFLLISLSFLAVLPPKYWLIESFANFGLYLLFCHLAASGAVHFLTAFNGRTRALFSSVNLAFVALFSLPLIPLYSGAQPPLPRHWPELRILYANVQTSNRDKESLLHLINNEQPDIIALLETDQAWVDAVSKGVTGYPLQISKPRTDNFGMAVFSRLPLAGEIRNFGDELPPSFSIPLKRANGGELRLIVLHCIPPLTQDALYLNWLLLRRAASDLRFSDVPTLIVGDLNATPYSRFFRDFQDWAALNYGWQGRGWTPTWNVKFPPIQLMIDHVFSKGSIVITEINTGREIGSDHLPLIIKAALPKSF